MCNLNVPLELTTNNKSTKAEKTQSQKSHYADEVTNKANQRFLGVPSGMRKLLSRQHKNGCYIVQLLDQTIVDWINQSESKTTTTTAVAPTSTPTKSTTKITTATTTTGDVLIQSASENALTLLLSDPWHRFMW